MQDIKSLTLEELTAEMSRLGVPAFRARQMYQWMHQKLVRGFDGMTNLPLAFREKCAQEYAFTSLKTVREQRSAKDDTRKYLFALSDGNLIESVWMKYKHGNSVCISSQAGCRMGCAFCASTREGLARSLTPSEMLDQIYAITLLTGERVSNVVVMGMGEPLDNYENLLKFIRLLSYEKGLHISQRSITVSTCGLVPQMRALAEEGLQITLALSLHAADDEKRKELMPVANRYSIAELMDACAYYFEKTGRRITFEYALIGGVNDGSGEAAKLGRLIGGLNCHVNLIPVNPVEEAENDTAKERHFRAPEGVIAMAFKNKLEKNGINVTIRREMGRDIEGACGQLRRRGIRR